MTAVPVVRWPRDHALSAFDPDALDELDGVSVLVIEGVQADDDAHLGWCLRAPCVVVGTVPSNVPASTAVDVTLGDEAADLLDRIVEAVVASPHAARALVQVLRAVPAMDVSSGLLLESFAYSALLAGPEFARWRAAQPERTPHTFSETPVTTTRAGDELRITLSRPGNRNAFSASIRDALVEALTLAEIDTSIERVVIDGDGPTFSSGGDLTEFGKAKDVVRAHEIRMLRSVGAVLARLVPRVTVIVHGACVGAGVELSTFATRLIARPDTTFRLPEVAMGLIPGAGGTVSVTRRVGRQTTARLALLGEAIDAEQALRIGLVDEVR